MKRNITCMLLTLSLLAVLAGTSLYAQSSSIVKVKIPFDFQVGTQSLPAGEYTVTPTNPALVMIRNKHGQEFAAAVTTDVQANPSAGEGKLIFNHYEDYRFLAQIFIPGETVGRQLLKSNVEQRVAGRTAPSKPTILTAQKANN